MLENALKRAEEFLVVGKKESALDFLSSVIKSKKHRTWQKIHEPVMLKFLELCVYLRKSYMASDGLYQYKSICQQVNISSLEDVVRAYLKLAEEKTEAAKEESQQMVLDIEDLDNINTPESVLLKVVSGENTQDRTNRLLLTPWVKFLWESYRLCLDLLKNNSKVERLYHDVAQQAFKFCLRYARKAEFRKLCDNLRMHLGQIQRHHNQSTATNPNNPESQSLHLETRLMQLDSAMSMELWQEAFKAIEDIHGLFSLSKKRPKPLMASYYDKVSTVFWKSGTILFHASALHRLYHLFTEIQKDLTQEERQRMSTRVFMATLAISIIPEHSDFGRVLNMQGMLIDKHRRHATLLDLKSIPTRESLIKDMLRFDLLQYVSSEVNELYNCLEEDGNPLKLCGRVTKVLDWVRDQGEKEADLQQYIPHLENNTVVRLLQQLSLYYLSMNLSRLESLVPFMNGFQLERIIDDAARYRCLQGRLDHKTRALRFGSDLNYQSSSDGGWFQQSMPSDLFQNQLSTMYSSLANAINIIKPASIVQEREEQLQQVITTYQENVDADRQHILARRQLIEERMECLERQNLQREKEMQEKQEAELQGARKAEEEQLRQEAEEREKERIKQEHEQIKKKVVREHLEQIKKTELGAKAFKDVNIEDLEELDPDFIMAKQVEQLEKEKKEKQERLKSQQKKTDHFERAKHLEEIPLIKKAYEEQWVKDKELWELQEEERINNMKEEHAKVVTEKHRLSRMLEDKEEFISILRAARKSDHEEAKRQFSERLEKEKVRRLKERKEQRKEERKTAYYCQKKEDEDRILEERLKKEHEEQERLEQERKEEEKREYQELLCKLDEQERKQRAKHQEIEERELRKEEELSSTHEDKSGKDRAEKAEGSWRRRAETGDTDWRRPVSEKDCRRKERKELQREEREPTFRRKGGEGSHHRSSCERGNWREKEKVYQKSCPLPNEPRACPDEGERDAEECRQGERYRERYLPRAEERWRRDGNDEPSNWRNRRHDNRDHHSEHHDDRDHRSSQRDHSKGRSQRRGGEDC